MVDKYSRKPSAQGPVSSSLPPADQNPIQMADEQNPSPFQSNEPSTMPTTDMNPSIRESLNRNSFQKKEIPDHKENIQSTIKIY
jgi:hypothetical protein